MAAVSKKVRVSLTTNPHQPKAYVRSQYYVFSENSENIFFNENFLYKFVPVGAIIAKKYLDQFRCAMPDCGKLLGIDRGNFTGSVEVRCKCGTDNLLVGTSATVKDLPRISESEVRKKTG